MNHIQSNSLTTLLASATVACAGCFGVMSVMSHSDRGLTLMPFFILSAVCVGLTVVVVMKFQQLERQIPFVWIICSAILFRLLGVLGQPIFEDDFYRYLWDGYRMAVTGDPYSQAPAEFFWDENVPSMFQSILSRISYPDISTIYGPVCQWIFTGTYFVDPGAIWPLQIISASADIGVICLLWSIRRNNYILLYAWSPLLIKEFAFTAHTDIVAVLLLVAALKTTLQNRPGLTGLLLGIALGTKIFALLLIPFLFIYQRKWKFLLYGLISLAGTVCLITWIFDSTLIWYPHGLRAMANGWIFNSPLYPWLIPFAGFNLTKLALLGIFSGACLTYFLFILKVKPAAYPITELRADRIFGGFLLCLAVINPWYLSWILPFAVLTPSRWAWTASFCLLLSYISGTYLQSSTLELYNIPTQILLIEYGVLFIALFFDWKNPLLLD